MVESNGVSVESKPSDQDTQVKIVFALKERVGALADALKIFNNNGINLDHIESRPSKRFLGMHEFLVDLKSSPDSVNNTVSALKEIAEDVIVHSWDPSEHEGAVPWFPTKIRDLDEFANRVLSYGAELDSDHPGFTDPIYRSRRKVFADIAYNYKHGQKIPRVDYTEQEIATWTTIYNNLTQLYPTHACKEFNYAFPFLQQNCNYQPNAIPQLQDVSKFLKDCTGFSLRPVAGLLSSRDFLAGLAFRVFHSTQYIRHSSCPMYTPEPDVCHELLGHVPLFADPEFADFSQQIGLASLGAPDDWIEKLATLYWFTVEFGLCRQEGEIKAYGAGLLSSFGELEYCITDKPEVRPFDPAATSITKYPITQFQPTYFVAQSFHDAKEKLSKWASFIPRPYGVCYNPYTQSVEILDNKQSVLNMARHVKTEFGALEDALAKLQSLDTQFVKASA